MEIILYREGKPLLGSDGIYFVDGRFNNESIKEEVRKLNNNRKKNFPHRMADAFAKVNGRSIGKIINL